jgi:hypothetical protein
MAHVPRQVGDANLMTTSGTYGVSASTANLPIASYGTLLAQHNSDIGTQIYTDYAANVTYTRTWSNNATAFTAWVEIGGGAGLHVSARFNETGSLHASYGVSSVVASDGNCQITFATAMIDVGYEVSGMCGGTDGSSTETFCNLRDIANYTTTSYHLRTVRAADNSDTKATGHTVANAFHPNMASIAEVRQPLSVDNVGVIENPDSTIRILNPATGWHVQECFDQIGVTGSIMDKSNVPDNVLLWDAWRLDSVNNTIYTDIAKAKEIVIGRVKGVVDKQLKAIRPSWEEAVDNDDTVWMDQIKADRKDIRTTLIAKISDINACTTVAEIEAYLP